MALDFCHVEADPLGDIGIAQALQPVREEHLARDDIHGRYRRRDDVIAKWLASTGATRRGGPKGYVRAAKGLGSSGAAELTQTGISIDRHDGASASAGTYAC